MIRRMTVHDRESDYLVVDRFLQRMVPARSLRSALDFGLIDQLASRGMATSTDLAAAHVLDVRAIDLLFAGLVAAEVAEHLPDQNDAWQLTKRFRWALRYRDLLEAKLDLALLVAADVAQHYDLLLADPDAFFREVQWSFGDRQTAVKNASAGGWSCASPPHEAPWLRLRAILTRYEADACLHRFPFQEHQRMLDVGGGSGEFSLQVGRHFPDLAARVVDQPDVCQFGLRSLASRGIEHSIDFLPLDVVRDPLPDDADLICFQSTLQRWSPTIAARLLRHAIDRLRPGGRLLIYERAPIPVGRLLNRFHLLPVLLQYRSLRPPEFYARILKRHGCQTSVQILTLDTPFYLVSGHKSV